MTRGTIVTLTAEQRRIRMLWLAQEATFKAIDVGITARYSHSDRIVPGYTIITGDTKCCDGFYLLKEYNGGKDPTAIDPFDRWSKPGSATVNRTADCIGGMAWCGGFDRYQPVRFAHLYDGWINTDSMIEDAKTVAKCFRFLDHPEPGCFVVFSSGSVGHAIGHIGGVTSVTGEWHPANIDSWRGLGVVDMAARVGPGNRRGNPLTWYNARASFIVPTMT